MISEAFCSMALALPLTHFHLGGTPAHHHIIDEVVKIRDFIQKRAPGAKIWIGPEPKEPNAGWERWPFTWRDQTIWIKRKPVSDGNQRRAA